MKKLFYGIILTALAIVFPIPAMSGIDIGISISLPPPVVFVTPPELIVIPETYVYVVPDLDADIFFYNGWWWRPWEGRWYRSRNYRSGWAFYRNEPSFYRVIPPGWRNDYREKKWKGHQWNYQRIPNRQVQQNWSRWEKRKHWEKQNTWGVQGFNPKKNAPQKPHRVVQPQLQQPHRVQPQPQQSRPPLREVKPEPPRQHQQKAPSHQKAPKPQKQDHQQRNHNK